MLHRAIMAKCVYARKKCHRKKTNTSNNATIYMLIKHKQTPVLAMVAARARYAGALWFVSPWILVKKTALCPKPIGITKYYRDTKVTSPIEYRVTKASV